MKKYIGFVMLAVLALSATFALAEETTGGASSGPGKNREELKMQREAFREKMQKERETFREDLKTHRDAWKAEVEKKKEEFKKLNPEMKKEFWNKAKRMIGERFEAAVKNIERIQGKVQELIDKLKTEGEDVTAAQESLDLSKSKLSDAKAKLAEIKALIPTDGSKITPEIFEQIKLKAREAKDLLKESHNNLKNAVKAIKELRDQDGDDDEDKDKNENENN